MVTKPQDHQGKKPKVKEIEGGMVVTFPDLVTKAPDGKAVTKDDKTVPLSVTVLKDSLDDFELLEDLRAIDVDQNATRLPALLRRLVGDQFKLVMDALRNDAGRVQIEPAQEWLRDLMEALNPNS
jgi:hypothetical protein